MTLEEFFRLTGGDAAGTVSRLGGAAAATRFLRLFPVDGSFSALTAALAWGDAEAAFRAAHTLKGVAANLGLERLRALASDMTECLRAGDSAGAQALLPSAEAAYRQVLDGLDRLG